MLPPDKLLSNEPLSKDDAIQLLIDTARGFYEKNWMPGTSGNLSLRSLQEGELRYLITASGKDKGGLTPADFVLVGTGGRVLDPAYGKSSAETLIHEAIYRAFPDVAAVYHVHTVAATVLSRRVPPHAEGVVFSNLEMLKGLGFDTHDVTLTLPVVDNTQDIASLAQTLPSVLQANVPGFLLRGHGLYAWGRTAFEARRHVEVWDFLCQVQLAEGVTAPTGVPVGLS